MAELTDELLRFAAQTFTSVYQLEILLHLRGQARETTVDQISRALYVPAASVAEALDEFVARGMAERTTEGAYAYRPQLSDVASLVDRIADCYSDYRVRIAGAIYSRDEAPRASPIQSFADSFRLRKGAKSGEGTGHG